MSGDDLIVLLLLAAGGLLVSLLVIVAAVLRRQREDHKDVSRRLNRIEREVERARSMVEQLAGGEQAPPPVPATVPVPKTPAPVEPILDAELAEEGPPGLPPLYRPEPVLAAARPEAAPARVVFVQPQPAPPPREPSRFETAAKEILWNIWNWIIVGEEHVPEGVSKEYAIASNWLLRVGVLILVMGVGFFLKYSVERGLIDELGRILLSTIAGLAMLVAGMRMLGRKYHLFGQGLIGAGIATLYFSVFAAHSFYHRIDDTTAFALMVVVTCIAGWIAVRFDSILVAVLGILGGYGTPIMLQTGVRNFPGLYAYLLILGLGVLGISYKKNWRLLNYLSFLGTYGLFFTTMAEWRYGPADFWTVMPFLVAFFALFSTTTFLFNLVHRRKSTLLEVLALWINAAVFFASSYAMVRGAYGEKWVAAVSLALAAFYAAHVYYFLIRRLLDRELMLSFTALAAFFIAVTIPLLLSSEWITASWALQALVMLWIAGKLQSEFLRQVAYLLYAIVLVRFGFVDLRQQYLGAAAIDVPVGDYVWGMVERVMTFGIPIASLAGGGWLLRQSPPTATLPVGAGNDVQPWVSRPWALGLVVAAVTGMLFLALFGEMNRSLGFFCPAFRLPMLSVLWVGLCVFLLYQYRLQASDWLLAVLVAFVAGLAVKLFFFDVAAWDLGVGMLYGGPNYSFLEAALRLVDFGAIIAFLACAFYLLPGHESARAAGKVFGTAAIALLFVFTTLEVNTFLHHYIPGLQAGGVSILWSIFALSLVTAGIWRDARAIRYAGLALFAVVAAKVLLLDLSHLEQIYRIVAFIVLGVLVLSGSFVYLMYRPMLAAARKEETVE
jgi:uncharacterized membrane protein